jgi:hypothetical protein
MQTDDMKKAREALENQYDSARARGAIERSVPFYEWLNGKELFKPALTESIIQEVLGRDVATALKQVNEWWHDNDGHRSLRVALSTNSDKELIFVLTMRS